jgi:hypothetical protein
MSAPSAARPRRSLPKRDQHARLLYRNQPGHLGTLQRRCQLDLQRRGWLPDHGGHRHPYELWANSFDPAIGLPAEDDDNDGVTNFEEYAFGLLPNNGASVNPIAAPLDKAAGTFSYTRRSDSGMDYSVWFSENLDGWTEDTSATEGTPVPNGDNETVEVTLSTLAGDPLPAKLFIQVRAN